MTRWIFVFLITAAGVFASATTNAQAETQENLFFLHHSTGRHLVTDGLVRNWITDLNQELGSGFVLWDHDYNYLGLSNPDGVLTDRCYNIPGDNTDPDGLHNLWTTSNSARDSILTNHQLVAFKSCYPASDIGSDSELTQYKTWYLEMRDFFDTQPNTTFIVMSTPPRHPLATDLDDADRARAFANWLDSEQYLSGHDNLLCFNLFDLWAHPDDGSPDRNMLREAYVRSIHDPDSHPNDLANQTVGPIFAEFLTRAGRVPNSTTSLGQVKALFR
jgi:hypothetical protein